MTPHGIHKGNQLIHPNWAHALTVAAERRHVSLSHRGETLSLALIGASNGAIVRNHHHGRDLRPNDVVWVKNVISGGKVIPNDDLQFFPEGLPGFARGTERVAIVEQAKGTALAQSATELSTNLKDLLQAADNKELGPLFDTHIALLELFITARPETAERLRRENPRKVKRMLERCLTLRDITGRRNPHSKVLGVKSSQMRLRSMSARRMATANEALTTSLTLNALMRAMHGLVAEVNAEIESKLDAKTWDMSNLTHRKWLKQFATRVSAWADEFENMNMHPFTRAARNAQRLLINAATLMNSPVVAYEIEEIQSKLRRVLVLTKMLLARFQVAEMLRVVGTARDERIQRLGLKIPNPVWTEIDDRMQEANEVFGCKIEAYPMTVNPLIRDARPEFYYVTLRKIAKFYDTASRNAA